MVYPALLPLMRTPQLPEVDGANAPANLNGLAHFAKRQNLVSARVPSHFNWPVHVGNLVHYALGEELCCKGKGPVIRPGSMFGGPSFCDVRRCCSKACRINGD
jgi:hypothetical protein